MAPVVKRMIEIRGFIFTYHHRINFLPSFRMVGSHVALAHVVQREEAFVACDIS